MKNETKNRIAFGLSRLTSSARTNGLRSSAGTGARAAGVAPRKRRSAARNRPKPIQQRYAAPAYRTTRNSPGSARSSDATPAAESVISTPSPRNTPAAPAYPARTPRRPELEASRPGLPAAFAQVTPRAVVVLGATAAQALLGPSFRVTRQRGELPPWPESAYHPEDFAQPGGTAKVLATLHPSAILRADDRDTAYKGLVDDLQVAASVLR